MALSSLVKYLPSLLRNISLHMQPQVLITHKLVAMIKSILDKTNDPYMGLLTYFCIPIGNGYSPSELLMGQNYVLHSKIPNELET